MSNYFHLNPEVAGGLGSDTVLDNSTHPPTVSRLHYEVIDWLGDCIVQTFPVFLVVRETGKRLESEEYSGFRLAEATVSEADEFQDINPDGVLPDLVWLIVDGQPGVDDLGLTKDARLVVNEAVLTTLRSGTMSVGTAIPWFEGAQASD